MEYIPTRHYIQMLQKFLLKTAVETGMIYIALLIAEIIQRREEKR